MSASWKFKVVKTQRGMDGKPFDHPTAATFVNEGDAHEYARGFAAEQRGVGGTWITVRTRGNKPVKSYPVT